MTVTGEKGWVIDDAVVHLRVRGTRGGENERALPSAPITEWTIGASPDCSIQLHDSTGQVSRRHAVLSREGAHWTAHDAQSTNGIRLDGEQRRSFDLVPGAELGIGSIELIAESPQLIALRDLLDRWIGWSDDRHGDVDVAMRAVRYMATRRAALVLRGEGDLAPVAARLHRQVIGDVRPFVLATSEGLAALHAATEGTLCIQAETLPRDWPDVIKGLRMPPCTARTIMCAGVSGDCDAAIGQLPGAITVELPSLASRTAELARVFHEYALDAVVELRASSNNIRPIDWERLQTWTWTGLQQLANDARRLVALRAWGVVDGAARLGITHGALSRWAVRRRLATF